MAADCEFEYFLNNEEVGCVSVSGERSLHGLDLFNL